MSEIVREVRATHDSTAVFSDDGVYRYELTRRWGDEPLALWIMLNPSTADASDDDPTIRRCKGFSKLWGAGGIVVTNLYALRSTDPKVLLKTEDPTGPENWGTIQRWLADTEVMIAVAAWGAWGGHKKLAHHRLPVEQTPARLHCLGVTGTGQPLHPLYLAKDTEPVTIKLALDLADAVA